MCCQAFSLGHGEKVPKPGEPQAALTSRAVLAAGGAKLTLRFACGALLTKLPISKVNLTMQHITSL